MNCKICKEEFDQTTDDAFHCAICNQDTCIACVSTCDNCGDEYCSFCVSYYEEYGQCLCNTCVELFDMEFLNGKE